MNGGYGQASWARAAGAARSVVTWRRQLCVGALATLACGWCCSCKPQPLHAPEPGLERMVSQEKQLPFGAEPAADGDPNAPPVSTMRTPPLGVVARDAPDGAEPAIDRAALERGERSFDAICAACHGVLGDGDSPVARRMAVVRPRDLLLSPVLGYDRAHLVQVMEQGFGVMPAVTMQLSHADCWDVAGYVKALQLSRGIALSALPPAMAQQARQALP